MHLELCSPKVTLVFNLTPVICHLGVQFDPVSSNLAQLGSKKNFLDITSYSSNKEFFIRNAELWDMTINIGMHE